MQGFMYRRIAYIVIGGACLLMCLLPVFFEKSNVSLWYVYATFIVLLSSSLWGYFFNYKQIVLTADQKDYLLTRTLQSTKIVKVIIQIICVLYFSYGYIYWLILEFVFGVSTIFIINYLLKKEYPWLKSSPRTGHHLKNKYPDIIRKTKQIFFHKIATFVLQQTSPLIIYAYASLTLVAIYGNYMLMITGGIMLLGSIFNGIGAGVGNLVAEGDYGKIEKVFWELFVSRFWLVSVFCFCMYMLTVPFMTLWVGEGYLLDHWTFILLLLYAFIQLTRVYDLFIGAYGLFQDIWAPIVEMILNLSLSILLGYFWGITGIVGGVLISLIIIPCGWKPYFLYKYGFRKNYISFIIPILKLILSVVLFGSLSYSICMLSFTITTITLTNFIIYALQILVVSLVIATIIFYVMNKGMRDFMGRIYYKLVSCIEK